MHALVKTTIIGVSFLAGAAIAAHADALSGSAGGAGQPMAAPQIAALPPANTAPAPHSTSMAWAPYSSGAGPRVGPNGSVSSGQGAGGF